VEFQGVLEQTRTGGLDVPFRVRKCVSCVRLGLLVTLRCLSITKQHHATVEGGQFKWGEWLRRSGQTNSHLLTVLRGLGLGTVLQVVAVCLGLRFAPDEIEKFIGDRVCRCVCVHAVLCRLLHRLLHFYSDSYFV
jgi:hypothetical protein